MPEKHVQLIPLNDFITFKSLINPFMHVMDKYFNVIYEQHKNKQISQSEYDDAHFINSIFFKILDWDIESAVTLHYQNSSFDKLTPVQRLLFVFSKCLINIPKSIETMPKNEKIKLAKKLTKLKNFYAKYGFTETDETRHYPVIPNNDIYKATENVQK